MKQFRSTGILTVLVALIVGYAYFVEYKGKEEKTVADAQAKKIIPFSLEDISGFDVKTPIAEYAFKKENGKWYMEKPAQDIANYAAVQGYLSQFGQESYEDVVAEGPKIDFSIYGLGDQNSDEKTSSITFTKKDKVADQTLMVEVGSATALGGKKYVRLNNQDKVLLANSLWDQQLQKSLTELREKNFLPPDYAISKIEVLNKGKLTFEQKDGKWILDELKTKDPDPVAVDDIYYQLKNLKATLIFRDDKSPQDVKTLGLLEPEVKIKAYGPDNKAIELEFSKNMAGQVYAISSERNLIFAANNKSLDPFRKNVEDFRDKKKPLSFNLSDVQQIEFRSDLAGFKLKKENNTWVSTEKIEGGKQLDNSKVVDILSKLSMMKVKKYLAHDVAYQKSGMNELKLKDSKGKELLNLQWSPKPVDDVFVAKSNLSDEIFGLSMQDIGSLPFQMVIADPPKPVNVEKVEGGIHIPAATAQGKNQKNQEKKVK